MAKFIDLDTGLPALLNKVKAWVNSKTSTKQDTIADLATIRTGAGKGATALQPSDVSIDAPSTPDGTFTLNVGSDTYTVNLNHTHENMAKLVVVDEEPSNPATDTIYALVDDASDPTEIQSLWIAGLEFVGGGGGGTAGQPRVTSPANGSTIDIGYNSGSGVSDTITVKGKDLTQGLTVGISGTGFSLTYGQSTGQSSVSIAQADALLGAQVTIVNNGSGRATDGVLVISHGNDVLSTVSVETSLLPSGYTKLDYIENIVKGLDTGIKATNSTTIDSSASGSSWEVDIQYNSVPSINQYVVCTDEDVAHWFMERSDVGKYAVGGGGYSLTAALTSRNTITVAFTGGSISATCGNETVTRAYTYRNNKNVCLFENINYTMQQYGGLVFKGKIYGAKCTSGGSFNGVPAKRNSDNHFGLYDTANSVFYDLSSNS